MRKQVICFLLICALLSLGLPGYAQQQKTLSGLLQDSKGDAVPGASVTEKGTPNGTSSDAQGAFTLIVRSQATLIISAVGFETQQLQVGNTSTLTIKLNPSTTELGGVVVTALGISKQRRQLGFSVTDVKGSEVAKTNEINPINALQGRVAGVQIDQGAGGLFGNSKIIIRGNSTLGTNNQPIFVIDGVIMDNGTFSGTGRDFGNDLKNLNAEDFESISILKGSAAAALYGSRAINGVVLITSKKGSTKKGVGVTLSQSVSISDPYAGPNFQNLFGGGTVGDFFTDKREPNYGPDQRWTTKVFPIDPVTGLPYIDRQIYREGENWGPRMLGQEVTNYDGTPTTYSPQPNNFLDAFQKGVGSNTNIALDGATDKSTFRLSYTHNESSGVVPTNKFKKDAFDLRATHQLTKDINIDAGMTFSSFNGQNPPRLGGLDAFASYNFGKLFTWVLPRNYNTNYWKQREKYTSIFGGTPDLNVENEPNKAPESRFWFNLYENEYLQKDQNLRGRISVNANLTSWAKLVLEGNINNIYTKRENKELGEGKGFSGGLYGLGYENKISSYLKALVMMNKDLGSDLTLSGYVGAEVQRFENSASYTETVGGLNYPGNYFITNSSNPVLVSGGPNPVNGAKKFNSLYASADIGFRNMLFIQATWRGDWSSALTKTDGSGNYYFNYPAISGSWIFTETFKRLPSVISFGKLRGSLSSLGSDLDAYRINTGFAFNGFSRANGGTVPTSTFNSSFIVQDNLQPSRKFSRELGLEMRFLKSRIGFDFTYYQDNTKNQIIEIPAPIESGATSLLINAGNIQNKGIELSIDATPVRTANFSWNTALNYSRNRNKIVELYPGRTEYKLPGSDVAEVSSWAIVGSSYGTLRTLIHSTPYQAKDGNGANVADAKNGLPLLSWRDNARAAFPARSNVWQDVGDMNAKFRGGWDNTFNYKNFSLNVLIDAKIGGDFTLMSYRQGTHSGVFPNTVGGRDAATGGITFTSKFDNIDYDDGRIVEGVFQPGQMITQPDGTQVDVGGLSFKEAYDKGFVEPTHTPQFFYRYGSSSTGVSDFWVLENSWISLRQVALSYSLPKLITQRLKLNGLSFAVVGRDLLYLYQTLPHNFNPASNNSNNTAFSGEMGFLPKTRNINFTLRASF